MNIGPETPLSRGLRRAAAIPSLLGLGLFIVSGLAGFGKATWLGLLVFSLLPYATVVAHLAVTTSLTKEEKAIWRRQLPGSIRSFIAVWAYLLSTDLAMRERGFASYRQ
jgi:hypothetical protein